MPEQPEHGSTVLTNTELNLLTDTDDVALLEQFRIATSLLESVAADRTVLERLSAEDRQRLHQAAASVYNPEQREAIEPQHCYVCKQKYTAIHHFSISA